MKDIEPRGKSLDVAGSVVSTTLEPLVHHQGSMLFDTSLADAAKIFREHGVEYLAITRGGRVTGICSYRRLANLLTSQFGYALHSRSPVHLVQVERPLVYENNTPMRTVLRAVMERNGEAFKEDLALVDAEHRLIGMIPVEKFAQLQTRLVDEQFQALRKQNQSLQTANEELRKAHEDQRNFAQLMKQQEKQVLFDTLVAGIAHELNNKLTPVQGFAELLLDVEEPELRKTYLNCVSKSVTEAAAIIRQLLQLSRPELGKMTKADLRDIIKDSALVMKFQIREHRAVLRTFLPEGPIHAMVDAPQLKQVLINLVINAIHATEGKTDPVIDISLGSMQGLCRIEVTDNGKGIPPQIINRIFDPFFTTKTPDRGSGLGLSVCLGIVRHHGGNITVKSELGRGATFLIQIPEAHGDARLMTSSPPLQEMQVRGSSLATHGLTTAAKLRVLVVDDEESVRVLMIEFLRQCFKCTVDSAHNGARGLELAKAASYDLILSDVRMPEMNGMEMFRSLNLLDPAAARRFVFMTGHAGEPEIEQHIAQCKAPVLKKPFSLAAMTEVCRPFLASRKAGVAA